MKGERIQDTLLFDAKLYCVDWDAFSNAIEPLRGPLERCVGLLTGDWDESASIVSETIARSGNEREKLRDGAPIYPWLRAIAINLSKQFLEKRKRQAKPTDFQSSETAASLRSPRPGVLTELLKDELATKLWLAIGQLPQAYREAVVLHYVDEMSYEEISEVTGVNPEALRARSMRGRNLLRGSLGSVVDTWMR